LLGTERFQNRRDVGFHLQANDPADGSIVMITLPISRSCGFAPLSKISGRSPSVRRQRFP
jgi:hypothetical protein